MLVDSHVNLHGDMFADDLGDVIERAHAANVETLLTICCKISEFEQVLAVANKHDNIWASVGTHPHEAKENPNIKPQEIIDLASHPKVIGIGETGLDFHYNYSERSDQLANFMTHIEAARETQLPLIIHSRNADEDMMHILQTEMAKGAFPALLHCYSSGSKLADCAVELGLYFSLSGIITFKNAHGVRSIAQRLPDDHIMIETDCPYLSPVPFRGRRNEPAYVQYVAEKLAELKGWTLDYTISQTTQAFFDLFQKAHRPDESFAS